MVMNIEKEREAFERTYELDIGKTFDRVSAGESWDMPAHCVGDYVNDNVQEHWETWQARAEKAEAEFTSSIDAINERSRLRVENDELRAQVERLRECANDLIGVVELDSDVDPDHALVVSARAVIKQLREQDDE